MKCKLCNGEMIKVKEEELNNDIPISAIFICANCGNEQKQTEGENKMEEQTTNKDWMQQELDQIEKTKPAIEQLEGLNFDEKKLYEIEIDVSKPWEKWTDSESQIVKKILPVTWLDKKYNFWLNTANPLYKQILESCKAGKTKLKIIRSGQKKATRYSIVN